MYHYDNIHEFVAWFWFNDIRFYTIHNPRSLTLYQFCIAKIRMYQVLHGINDVVNLIELNLISDSMLRRNVMLCN